MKIELNNTVNKTHVINLFINFICSCLDTISLQYSGAISEERLSYFIRRQKYIERVMRDTSNADMQS